MGLLLYILSSVLSCIIFPIGFVYGIVNGFVNRRLKTGLSSANKKMWTLAASVDKYGNVMCAELFNAVLIQKQSKHRFGRIEETISEVLGYNQFYKQLTGHGWFWVRVLNFFQEEHCLKSINAQLNRHTSRWLRFKQIFQRCR